MRLICQLIFAEVSSCVTDNLDGTYSATYSSWLGSGVATISASVNGIEIAQKAIITIVADLTNIQSKSSPPIVVTISGPAKYYANVPYTIKVAGSHSLGSSLPGYEWYLYKDLEMIDGGVSALGDTFEKEFTFIDPIFESHIYKFGFRVVTIGNYAGFVEATISVPRTFVIHLLPGAGPDGSLENGKLYYMYPTGEIYSASITDGKVVLFLPQQGRYEYFLETQGGAPVLGNFIYDDSSNTRSITIFIQACINIRGRISGINSNVNIKLDTEAFRSEPFDSVSWTAYQMGLYLDTPGLVQPKYSLWTDVASPSWVDGEAEMIYGFSLTQLPTNLPMYPLKIWDDQGLYFTKFVNLLPSEVYSPLDITLVPAKQYLISVKDQNGANVSNYKVHLLHKLSRGVQDLIPGTTFFTNAYLTSGLYSVIVTCDGFMPDIANINIPEGPGSSESMQFTLRAGSVISGTIKNEAGDLLEYVTIMAHNALTNSVYCAVSDESGSFLVNIPNDALSVYSIEIIHPGYQHNVSSNIVPGSNYEFTLSSLSGVGGPVFDNSKVLTVTWGYGNDINYTDQVELFVFEPDSVNCVAKTKGYPVNGNGSEIISVIAGTYDVIVKDANGYGITPSVLLTENSTAYVYVNRPLLKIFGIVRLDGIPVPGAEVEMRGYDSQITNTDGSYEFNVFPGTYTLLATQDDGKHTDVNISVGNSDINEDIDLPSSYLLGGAEIRFADLPMEKIVRITNKDTGECVGVFEVEGARIILNIYPGEYSFEVANFLLQSTGDFFIPVISYDVSSFMVVAGQLTLLSGTVPDLKDTNAAGIDIIREANIEEKKHHNPEIPENFYCSCYVKNYEYFISPDNCIATIVAFDHSNRIPNGEAHCEILKNGKTHDSSPNWEGGNNMRLHARGQKPGWGTDPGMVINGSSSSYKICKYIYVDRCPACGLDPSLDMEKWYINDLSLGTRGILGQSESFSMALATAGISFYTDADPLDDGPGQNHHYQVKAGGAIGENIAGINLSQSLLSGVVEVVPEYDENSDENLQINLNIQYLKLDMDLKYRYYEDKKLWEACVTDRLIRYKSDETSIEKTEANALTFNGHALTVIIQSSGKVCIAIPMTKEYNPIDRVECLADAYIEAGVGFKLMAKCFCSRHMPQNFSTFRDKIVNPVIESAEYQKCRNRNNPGALWKDSDIWDDVRDMEQYK